MINLRRVRFFRKLIYVCVFLVVFLPIILMITLNFEMAKLTDVMSRMVDRLAQITEQAAPTNNEPIDQGYVIPPSGTAVSEQESPDENTQQHGQASASLPTEAGALLPETILNTYEPDDFKDLYFNTLPPLFEHEKNTIYLTFDNTPSYEINDLLDLLDKHNVKCTFFVWSGLSDDNALYNKIVRSGHSIGIHSNLSSDSMAELYSSKDAFLANFNAIFHKIESATGIRTRLYRLPGGSVSPNSTERQAVIKSVKSELDARGFLQYDWNASAQDAVRPTLSKETILDNIKRSISEDRRTVVLMHDGTGSTATLEALDELITEYKALGYSFKAINYDTVPVSFLAEHQ